MSFKILAWALNFLSVIGLYVEEAEISKFVLNFSSYVKDIKEVYERINDYRRKGQGDLRVYNAFEKAFNALEQTVLEMQDGKLVRNNLGSNLSYLSEYPYLEDIIVSNIKPVHTANDFDGFVEQFSQIEKALLIKADVPQLTQEFKADINLERLMTRKAQKELVRAITQENNRTIHLISNLLSRNIRELRKPDPEVDIISKVDHLLRSNLNNYRPFFTLYAYIFLRKNVKSVQVGYNQRLTLKDIDGKESITYRPIYIKGHNHD